MMVAPFCSLIMIFSNKVLAIRYSKCYNQNINTLRRPIMVANMNAAQFIFNYYFCFQKK